MTNTNVPQWEERELSPKELAGLFHDTYEGLAPSFGYETREDTKVFDENSKNGKLMIAVCEDIKRTYIDQRIYQAIQEERQRIVEMIEKKYSDHGAYEEWNVVREIINLIHKE